MSCLFSIDLIASRQCSRDARKDQSRLYIQEQTLLSCHAEQATPHPFKAHPVPSVRGVRHNPPGPQLPPSDLLGISGFAENREHPQRAHSGQAPALWVPSQTHVRDWFLPASHNPALCCSRPQIWSEHSAKRTVIAQASRLTKLFLAPL